MDYQANIQEVYTIPSQAVSREWVQKLFVDVIENIQADERVFSHYFSPQYVQHVNGETFNYSDFVQHMKVQKGVLQSAKVTIERCVIQGNSFSTVHRVHAIKKNGDALEAKVIAHFEVKDGKIILCDELTRLISGSKEDEDLGSRK